MTKLQNNKGFTLVELLIVIAIIAILAAVAVPVYSAQMESARLAVDVATVRSAASMASGDYLLAGSTGDVSYGIIVSNGDVNSVTVEAGVAHSWVPESIVYTDALANNTVLLTITTNGEIKDATDLS